MTSQATGSGLPAIQCVITGLDVQGRSTALSDATFPTLSASSGASFSLPVWGSSRVPAFVGDPDDGPARAEGFGFSAGSLLRIIDMLPGQKSPMHKTGSIDYVIVLDGEIEMEMDDGGVITVGAGGVIVQQATHHLWRNSSGRVCRMAVVMIEAVEVEE